MGLQSALTTALTGMTAAETTIDVVGNNVANANTVGFKESQAIFATQFLQNLSLGSSPTDFRGGTNPRQIGLGTKVASISPDFSQGTIEISSNPLDLAIQGDGFFVVQGSQGEQLYTRNGQFGTNANNEIVTINGQRLLGFGVDGNFQVQRTGLVPLTIPSGTATVAQATQNVFLEGNLLPTGDLADTPAIVQSVVLSDGTVEVPANLDSSDIETQNAAVISASTVQADPTPGTVAPGEYRYRVAYVDVDGNEMSPSDSLGPIITTGTAGLDTSILLQTLPVPSDTVTFPTKNVYRSLDGGDFQLVSNLAATDLNYTDSADQASLGDTLDNSRLDLGVYSYHVTFYNTSTGLESRPTAVVGPQAVQLAGQRIRIENLPTPSSGEFDSLRIYRNLASDNSQFFRVAELSSSVTSFVDNQPDVDVAVAGNELNFEGPPVNFGLSLVDVVTRTGSVYSNPFSEGSLTFTPRKGGRQLDAKTLEVTADTTVSDLITFMDQSLGILNAPGPDPNFPVPGTPGGTLTADSRIQITSNMGVDSAVDIGLSAFSIVDIAGVEQPIGLAFAETQQAIGESTVADFVVFDTLGIPLSTRVTFTLEQRTSSSTTYRWSADSPDNGPLTGVDIAVGTGTITFDGEGNLVSASESTISIERQNVASASPLEFELDFDGISGLSGERSGVNAVRQDGSAAGTLSSFIVTESGQIVGVFTNGISRDLGQVRMARFTNNDGLQQVGDNLFAGGVNSGLPVEGDPGEQGNGIITSGSIELSNTDIGQNLIDLILASTQYRGGARVITAVQELFDELLALRR